MWTVTEKGIINSGNEDGWPLNCSGMRADCCTLRGVEFSGCCAEIVACGEGKKCHNPSGDNQELSFETSDHIFGYGRTEMRPSIHIPMWGERGVCAWYVHPQPALINTLGCSRMWTVKAHGTYGVKKRRIFARGNPITCRRWHGVSDEEDLTKGLR